MRYQVQFGSHPRLPVEIEARSPLEAAERFLGVAGRCVAQDAETIEVSWGSWLTSP